VPFGATTATLAIDCCRWRIGTMIFDGLQVTPPSVVFEKYDGPVNELTTHGSDARS